MKHLLLLLVLLPSLASAQFQEAQKHFDQGLALYYKKEYLNASESFSKAIRHKKDFEDAYYNRARCKYNLEDIEGAIKDVDRAIKYRSDNPVYFLQKGKALMELEEFEKAVQSFSETLKIDPDYIDGLYYRGAAR